MRIYAESNFVLEMALDQEQAGSARGLLGLAPGAIELVVPQFALCEPFEVLGRRAVEREQLARDLARPVREMKRSAHHEPLVEAVDQAVALLNASGQEDMARLEETLLTVTTVARLVPVDSHVFGSALDYRDRFGFDHLQDAIILASVVADLAASPCDEAAYVSRDDHFHQVAVRAELADRNCKLLRSFTDALSYAQRPQG